MDASSATSGATAPMDTSLFQPVPPRTVADPQTRFESREVTPEYIEKHWRKPSCQRMLVINTKVRACAEELTQNGGLVHGVITIGCLWGILYLLDGQHRVEAAKISGLPSVSMDIRYMTFASQAAMDAEFVILNSNLVPLKPDDLLRGMETSLPALALIKRELPFVGYTNVRRRSTTSPMVSMCSLIRMWNTSAADEPRPGGPSALSIAKNFDDKSARNLVAFAKLAHDSWGNEETNWKFWCGLNLMLNMWLYRRIVVGPPASSKIELIKPRLFGLCLQEVAASGTYSGWLHSRTVNDRDRGPAYSRLRILFARRILSETRKKMNFPNPEWAANPGRDLRV